MPARLFSSARRAFTLIELLASVGVIGLLLAIALPAVSRARENARAIKCASNERQIMMAVFTYAGQNNRKLPIFPTLPDQDLTSPYRAMQMESPGNYNYARGTLWTVMNPVQGARRALFNCPTDESETRAVLDPKLPAGLQRNFSYSFNHLLYGVKDSLTGRPSGTDINQILHPSQKILLTEEQGANDGSCVLCVPSAADVLATRHTRMGNQGFADGHIERVSPFDVGVDPDGQSNMSPVIMSERRSRYCDLFSK